MMHKTLTQHISLMILAGLLLLLAQRYGWAQDLGPSPEQKEIQEYRLKQQIEPIFKDILKERFVALSVHYTFVNVKDPIIKKGSKVQKHKLPGFKSYINTADDKTITGFLDKYERFRNVTVVVTEPLPEHVQENLQILLKDKAEYQKEKADTFVVLVTDRRIGSDGPIEEEDPKKKGKKNAKKRSKDLVDELEQDREEREELLSRLFPTLDKPPGDIDPRKQAVASQHLIKSRTAYFNNDLNQALNEVIEAINVNPYSSKSYEMLGSIYYRLKWNKLALNNWTKALALDPTNQKLTRYIEKVKGQL